MYLTVEDIFIHLTPHALCTLRSLSPLHDIIIFFLYLPIDDPATCFAHDEKDFESNETVWALYERWCSFHSAEHDHDDMVRWFGCFKDRARRIIEFNKSSKPYTWGVGAWGLNIFDDMTPEELFEFGNN